MKSNTSHIPVGSSPIPSLTIRNLAEESSGMRDKVSFEECNDQESTVSAIATEMQGIVYRASEPISPGETVKAQIKRAWETLGRPPYWRVRAAWYGEAGCWVAVATEDFRARDARRRRKEEAGRAQANELAQTYLAASARLREIDEDFHSTEIARLERVAREVGAVDRAVAETPE